MFRLHVPGLFALACGALAGLSALPAPAAAQLPPTLKIGVLNDQSGPFADQSGRGSVVAAQLAAEDFAREAPTGWSPSRTR